jgi:FtsZ-binding cell division protein ZapB
VTVKKTRENEQQMALAGTEEGEILARLGERVEKAVAMIAELRRERDQLKAKLEETEAKAREGGEAATRLSSLEEEHDRFRRERGEIRNRIESILGNLEALDTTEE